MRISNNFLELFSKHNFIYKVLLKKIVKSEGGEKTSQTLRKMMKEKYNVNVGMHSYGSCFNEDFSSGNQVNIGRYCSFGANVKYFGSNHPIKNLSTSPYFYNKYFSSFDVEDVKRTDLNIGNDVWVGYGVIITSSCTTIGNGAVIGASSVVTKDVPPYSIFVGNPGKVIRYRFDNETINDLEKSKWWERDPKELMKVYEDFKNPRNAVKRLNNMSEGDCE